MKKLGLMGMITASILFMAFGTTAISAEDGMGKCGKSKEKMMDRKMMDEEKMKKGKCGAKKEKKHEKKMNEENNGKKKSMKCGVGKCGS